MPKATCRQCFSGVTLVKTPVLALPELREPAKYHGGDFCVIWMEL